MKENRAKDKGQSPCTMKYTPVPEFVTCPKCGEEIELWSDEEETVCVFCGDTVFKKGMRVHECSF